MHVAFHARLHEDREVLASMWTINFGILGLAGDMRHSSAMVVTSPLAMSTPPVSASRFGESIGRR